MKNIFYTLSLLLLIVSCRKKATIKLPVSEKKLVVTCFLEAGDSLATAIVRTSSPKFAGNNGFNQQYDDVVSNATVKISDGQNTLELQYDVKSQSYKASTLSFPITSGKTYYLNVNTPDGKNVSASTTVPTGKLEYESFKIQIQKNDSNSLEYVSSISVTDQPEITNYLNINYQNITSSISSDPKDAEQNYVYPLRFFDTDEKISKTQYNYNTQTVGLYLPDPIRYAAAYIAILNCSKEFYLYNKSAEQAYFNNGNPFSDPVLVYSNINNGFGCFGSFVGNYVIKRIR